jgi:hypothetical protein
MKIHLSLMNKQGYKLKMLMLQDLLPKWLLELALLGKLIQRGSGMSASKV